MTRRQPQKSHDQLKDKYGTLDWDEIRRNYEARLESEIARGVDNRETRRYLGIEQNDRPRDRANAAFRASFGSDGRPRVFDRDRIRRLYQTENRTVPDIAEELGAFPDTIRNILKNELKIYDPKRDLGRAQREGRGVPQKKDVCSQGHSMDDAYIWTDGKGREKRECRTCRRERNANG